FFLKMILSSVPQGLFPAILNLASNAEISTNATCGEPLPEMYCKLVEHVPGRRIRNPQCRTCDANSANLKERHPITNAIDGTNQWWQSPSIKNGRQFHWVTVTLDLRQIFQVAYVIIKAANSPRPGNWILERSLDGINYQPWQYYAISDTECLTRYNITPRLGPPTYKRDEEVICTSYYSRLVPLEHGEIHTSLINGRPGADDLTPELLEFTSARFIRLRLQRIRTLNADLMTLSYRDPKDVDPIVTRRYYYSIKDISVGGMCICYGHAQSCPWDPVTKKLQCVCEHNTCGESCNECCPGYHQELWQPGTISDGNTCEKCNCHNKAEDCYYNQTVADLKMSLNTHGQFVGGGVCINCTQNTAGVNCETCADGYYRPHKMSPYATEPCLECNCDMRGSVSHVCLKDDKHANPGKGLLPGQCVCKEGFAGEKCDRCAFGYRDFPLCTRCECSLEGSHNIDPCRECICKVNVMGANCDLCKQGFYNLQASNPEGCTECFCFGVSDVCESSTWNTSLLTAYGSFLNYSVAYDASVDNNVDKTLPSHFDVVIQGNGRSLRQLQSRRVFLNPHMEQHVVLEFLPHFFVDMHTERRVQRDELMSVLADVASLRVRAHLNTSVDGVLRLSSVSLAVADPISRSAAPAPDVEQCECPWGYSGTSCEYCISGFYRVGGILFGGNCLQCECNDHATECDINGVCLGCSHNTTGPHCDQCLPGYYGDPTEGTAEDCQRCACPLTLASNNFSPTCSLQGPGEIMCDQCEQGYTGTKCERCANGYYGNPTVAGQKCSVCECNGNVDPSEPGHCDAVTGECLKCVGHTSGRYCERCEDGYFGDAVTAKDCQGMSIKDCFCVDQVGFHGINSGDGCRQCECSQSGSVSEACEEDGQCQCIVGVSGAKCDRCQQGFYNFTDGGCTPCDCAHTHGNCNAETGECICPPHTRGEKCEVCEEDHWGHDAVTGCKPCECSVDGSNSSQCDLLNGQCACRPHFASQKCDRCALGYRKFPECTACNCNTNGTREDFCDDELEVCGCEDHGQCVCKDNVGGGGCDECKTGTFGLWGQNPSGCSPCFCFGVSTVCEELGGLVRVPVSITVGPEAERLHVVSQSDLKGTLEGVYHTEGEMLLDVTQLQSASSLTGPYYWRLPQRFQGSKLLSYGGDLSYSVAFAALDGSGLSNYEPQVLIRGGHLKKLVIYMDMPAPENSIRTTQRVPLTEHKWKYFNAVSEKAVSHADFMSILSNVEYIFIKASYGTGLQQSRISNISMDTAVEADEAPEGTPEARLVEACECPPGYAGLSCQECAPGYYRQHVSELNMKGMKRPMMQPCVPCQCNNHSLACDLDTGKCLGCQHNTTGENCNVCTPGYYGQVKGSISDCSLCACPLHSNSFSPTCVLEGVGDFRCDACKPGYEGRYCERCSLGYYGNPSEPGGKCEVCQCTESGSLHPVCDSQTGKCECKAGVRGHLCDQCEDRHVLSNDQCLSCDDGCTGLLLDDVDAVEASIQSLNLSGVILAPYSLLISLENQTQELQVGKAEEEKDELVEWSPTLRKHVDTLVMELTKRDALQLVYRAEDHAQALSKEAQAVYNTLTGVREASTNITSASQVNSNISDNIHQAENQALSANQTASSALSLVSHTVHIQTLDGTEAHLRTERLFDRLKPLKTLGENLSRNLTEIKELINQARMQAASIKVAVSANRDCVRAYKPEVTSSNFNTLTLTVKTTEPDNLLFYMGSSSSVDFMALEMRHGKVSFLWDVGSGHARLEYPSVQINNNKWHRINATRFGKQGSLTVQQLDSEPMPSVKTTAPGSSTVMDINKSTWVFVGGLSGQVKKSSAVKMTHFKGCMGEASLNEKNIGLWNYAEREGGCGGCFKSPQLEETSFYFDGSGYSVVEKSLRSISTSIVMFFKTLSPNGLLLYLASNGTRDFLSIELVEGKVHVTFELGSGPLTLTSSKAYNTGVWYKIALQRNKRKGYLAVMAADNASEREVMEAESPGTASDLNRSDLDPIYIGGLPASRPIRRQVVARSYVGCIKNVEIARTNFDLLRESYGVKKGCILKPIRSVSVLGGGYVQMPAVTVGPQTEIISSFSSRNSSGLILAGFNSASGRKRRHTQQSFLAVMLVSGRLEVHVSVAEGAGVHKAVIKSQSGTFSDGEEHSLILQRNKRSDTEQQETVRLGSAAEKVLSLSDFYIGGVPEREATAVLTFTTSFYGCIRNTAVDGMLLDLSGAVKYEQVDLDSCLLEERPKHIVLPDEGDVESEPTAQPTLRPLPPHTELNAASPGATTVKLSIRTLAPNGVLYYMANANQQDYAVLQLQGGRLLFSCDLGKGPAITTAHAHISDGQWHTVRTDFGKKSTLISVDGVDSERTATKGHTLDVEGKLYLGGLPTGYTAKKIGNVTHSIAGCMQKVKLNGAEVNLQNTASSHHTGLCFTSAQEGTFFNGSGYAAFVKEGYYVGSDVTVSLEFRSTAPEGVLLGVSSTRVDAIGLELMNGQVVFNVNNGAGRFTAVSRSRGLLCDGRWHTLVAKKLKHSLILIVDGLTVSTENPHSSSTSAETKNPIYIGGYPAGVKQSCLSSRASFRGCMRNLRLTKGHITDNLDFSSAFAHPDVSPHSCPASPAA
uniref:Basement membrane-specific heparan sulfate proteoglycan core protein n=1 Tax=Astyanax mexicanus TaxID=7994 RepID=A0A8B9K033_ASTMX